MFYKLSVEVIVALLIVLWIYTGLNKMLDYQEFRTQLGRSPFIEHMAGFISLTLPAGEILIAALLVFKRTRLIGLYASFFMMAMFTGYVYIMLHYSFDLPCSCGGVLAKLSWPDHLLFNAAFTVLALIGIILQVSIQHNKPSQIIALSH